MVSEILIKCPLFVSVIAQDLNVRFLIEDFLSIFVLFLTIEYNC